MHFDGTESRLYLHTRALCESFFLYLFLKIKLIEFFVSEFLLFNLLVLWFKFVFKCFHVSHFDAVN